MNTADELAKLQAAAQSVSTAVMVLRMELPTLEAFLEESRRMESVGPVLAPSLFNSSERRAAEALLKPLFQAAVDLVRTHDTHIAKSKDALAQVKE